MEKQHNWRRKKKDVPIAFDLTCRGGFVCGTRPGKKKNWNNCKRNQNNYYSLFPLFSIMFLLTSRSLCKETLFTCHFRESLTNPRLFHYHQRLSVFSLGLWHRALAPGFGFGPGLRVSGSHTAASRQAVLGKDLYSWAADRRPRTTRSGGFRATRSEFKPSWYKGPRQAGTWLME